MSSMVENKELKDAKKANKQWKVWWDKSLEQNKEMRVALEARIEDLTRLLREAQDHVVRET